MDLSRYEMMFDKESIVYEEDSFSVMVVVRVRFYSIRYRLNRDKLNLKYGILFKVFLNK